MAAVRHTYSYMRNSSFRKQAEGNELYLATSDQAQAHPYFFYGTLVRPREAADLLLALMEVVNARFHTPPAMLERILRNADPVVTSNDEILRFEAFSA